MPVRLEADALVISCPDTQVGVRWPLPVHQRLEELLERARTLGESTSKRELLSAIVCTFDPRDEDFHNVLRRYRTSRVDEVALREPDEGNVVSIDRYGPGRRRRTPER